MARYISKLDWTDYIYLPSAVYDELIKKIKADTLFVQFSINGNTSIEINEKPIFTNWQDHAKLSWSFYVNQRSK